MLLNRKQMYLGTRSLFNIRNIQNGKRKKISFALQMPAVSVNKKKIHR